MKDVTKVRSYLFRDHAASTVTSSSIRWYPGTRKSFYPQKANVIPLSFCSMKKYSAKTVL